MTSCASGPARLFREGVEVKTSAETACRTDNVQRLLSRHIDASHDLDKTIRSAVVLVVEDNPMAL